MRTLRKIVVISILSLALIACGKGDSKSEILNIGVIQFASHEALDNVYAGFIDGLDALGLEEGIDYKIDFNNAQSDTATAETIADKLVNNKSDLILAIATPAAQAVANKTSEIPILFGAVTDPKSAGLVIENENPQTNVTGVSDLTPIREQIDLIKIIDEDVKKVAVMYANSEDNSRFQADIAKSAIESLGMEYIDASVSESNQIQQMTESIINKVDAIYVPTDNLISESFALVANIANDNQVITVVGEIGMVNKGGLITNGINYYNSGVKISEQAKAILIDGEAIETMPVGYLLEAELELAVNHTTMEILNIKIKQDILGAAIEVK